MSIPSERGTHPGPSWGEASSKTDGRSLGGAWPFAVFAILTAAFHFDLLSSRADDVIATPDITKYLLWLHGYARDHLLSGRIPLWNPYTYGGVPFAANPQTSVFYPLSWIYLLMPVGHAHKWMIAIHTLMAGSFSYLYLRGLGLERLVAMAACLPWMFGSYLVANAAVGHLTMLFTATWLPLALYCYERALQGRALRWLFWTGFVLGIQVLAGEPQNSYYTAVLVTGYGLIRIASEARGPSRRWLQGRCWRWLSGLVVIGLVAALTSAMQLFPTLEMASHSDRTESTYEFATNMSFHPRSFAGFLIPWSGATPWLVIASSKVVALNWELAGYVGIMILVLAGVSVGLRRPPALIAAQLLGVLGLVLMLGGNTPLYRWLLAGLPGLSLFRIPARALVIVEWALIVMSAFGLQWLVGSGSGHWRTGRWRAVAVSALLVGAGLLAGSVVFGDLRTGFGPWSRIVVGEPLRLTDPVVLKPLSSVVLTLLVVVTLRWMTRRVALVTIVALVAADLLVAKPAVPVVPLSEATSASLSTLRTVQAYTRDPQPFRVDLAPSMVDANAAIGARIENVNGYWPVALRRFYRYAHAMRGLPPSKRERHQLHDDLYVGGDLVPLRLLNVKFTSRIDGGLGVVIRLGRFLPRAWVVDQAEVLSGETETLDRLGDPAFDPARTVILEHAPRLALAGSGSSPGRVTVRTGEDGELEIDSDTERDGYLVLSSVFYPGWRATVDGRDVPVERADYLISALPLPAGRHRLSYRYEPLSLRLGAVGTLVACIAALGLLTVGGRSSAPRPD